MANPDPKLGTEDDARGFYDDRFTLGYMDSWPASKLDRVAAILSEPNLLVGDVGTAIDFGCGQGVFTQVLRRSLPPAWDIFGVDISSVALSMARQRFPDCDFISPDEWEDVAPYDLLFSHHVLEHVLNLDKTLSDLDLKAKPEATVVHVLPCGNEGSLEHTLCLLRHNGISTTNEGRYFFEDPSHLRRISSNDLSKKYALLGYKPRQFYFANQWRGAIDWITSNGPTMALEITDPSHARGRSEASRLRHMRMVLVMISLLRSPAAAVDAYSRRRNRTAKNTLIISIALPFWPLSSLLDWTVKKWAAREWVAHNTDTNGSEMFVTFIRTQGSASSD